MSAQLLYPSEEPGWAIVPSESMQFSEEQLQNWLYSVGALLVGRGHSEDEAVRGVKSAGGLYPAPDDRDRCVFVPLSAPALVPVEFEIAAVEEGWQQRAIDGVVRSADPRTNVDVAEDAEINGVAESVRVVVSDPQPGDVQIAMHWVARISGVLVRVSAMATNPVVAGETVIGVQDFLSKMQVQGGG